MTVHRAIARSWTHPDYRVRLLILTVVVSAVAAGCKQQETRLLGAGSSAVAGLYVQWAEDFERDDPNVDIVSEALGSDRGVELFMNNQVDFAITEVPVLSGTMSDDARGFMQLPLTVGAIVVAFNLDDIKALDLTRDVLAEIYSGEITSWNDPRIQATNPDVALPDLPIIPVHRVDGSGSTYTFTTFLSIASDTWRNAVGSGSLIKWPTLTGALGTRGMMETVLHRPGAVGYLPFNAIMTRTEDLGLANVENAEGVHVEPTVESIEEAVRNAEGMEIAQIDARGRGSYPIVMVNYALVRNHYPDPRTATALRDYLLFTLSFDNTTEEAFGFSLVPEPVRRQITTLLGTIAPEAMNSSQADG